MKVEQLRAEVEQAGPARPGDAEPHATRGGHVSLPAEQLTILLDIAEAAQAMEAADTLTPRLGPVHPRTRLRAALSRMEDSQR